MREFITLMERFIDTNDENDVENEVVIHVTKKYFSKVKTVLDHAKAVQSLIDYQCARDDNHYTISMTGPSTYVDVVARHLQAAAAKVNRPGTAPEITIVIVGDMGLDKIKANPVEPRV